MDIVPAPKMGASPTTLAVLQTSEPSSELFGAGYYDAMIEGIERQQYRSTRLFFKAIESKREELHLGGWEDEPYMVFTSVTEDRFAAINLIRDGWYKGLRFLYFSKEEILRVRV